MTNPITTHQQLSENDIATIRQLYSEVQNWTRHYEQLIVNANVLIVSACLIFVGLAFGDKVTPAQAVALLLIPVGMSGIGIVLTKTLFNLYATCVERMIRLENLLGCYDAEKFRLIDNGGPLLAHELMTLPVKMPTSVRFFVGMQIQLIVAYVAIGGMKLL